MSILGLLQTILLMFGLFMLMPTLSLMGVYHDGRKIEDEIERIDHYIRHIPLCIFMVLYATAGFLYVLPDLVDVWIIIQ